ncbi:hypothetical protein GGR53DRAFT_482013 [Hypoxylon sp. FL1150]|nr:hypothetical protein GGR53DRAFT_482013 [Hypoxylon sp. FL1150]
MKELSTAVLLIFRENETPKSTTYESFAKALSPYVFNGVCLLELKTFFHSWQNETAGGSRATLSHEGRVFSRLHRNIRPRTCVAPSWARVRRTKETTSTSFPAATSLFFLGQEVDAAAYHIIGWCYHLALTNRQALWGEVPGGWRLLPGGVCTGMSTTSERPRLCGTRRWARCPPGWREKKRCDGGLSWISNQYDHKDLITFDARLEADAVKARGVPHRQITLV